MIRVVLPIKTVSEANRASHEHWRERQKRAKGQRHHAAYGMLVYGARSLVNGPWRLPTTVTIVRIAPRALDSDNLASSAKHVRDGIADAMCVDDRDPRIEWRYEQRKGKPREYAVEIVIEPKEGG